ncbi:sema domain, seven thrombospondin repeats (type 1 and type 1-like), transmembrane domain (TM) and short cytoplasmic domain, (semaphorin) 5B (predicted), isoform CRA_c [Rattus norvegicus]|uniref:Sema domain, seven thrombospondin repeats (Type 1 and type 1-like), transmembrane domain (TM) and short cytoplasmic domain, (Semaphorin) 5B (Predicted), isoform CRA_c n=1 Tax=Rattus norvegicus TaxID=10116 RepID=A6IRF9_RAT|nr:sema domain, seven thrombospondin repeats (type 1 and type 1-like), transmembrane domain (TM) and short cytoplasmic domain, (semaphorin) 5B (predicted), isoform CRA_c [Rattus norvegicus]
MNEQTDECTNLPEPAWLGADIFCHCLASPDNNTKSICLRCSPDLRSWGSEGHVSLSPPTPPGMGRGPHGHRGLSAARPVGSASRSVSEVAATQRPAMGAASAWARAGRSGSVMKIRLARCPSSGLPGARGASAAATVGVACSRAVVLARMATRARVAAW